MNHKTPGYETSGRVERGRILSILVVGSITILGLLVVAGGSHAHEEPAEAQTWKPAWEIHGHEVCDEETRVVDRNVTVHEGGVLELRGCRLSMDSPVYDNQYGVHHQREGLKITVEEGGKLLMESTEDREAGLERHHERFGYTVVVHGSLEAAGTPQTPVNMTGLEGHMAEQFIGFGLEVYGNASLDNVSWADNGGPLFPRGGGVLEASNITTDNRTLGTLAASSDAEVRVEDSYLAGGFETTRITTANATFENTTFVNEQRGAMVFTRSNVILDDVEVRSPGVAVRFQASSLSVRDSEIHFEQFGVAHEHKRNQAKHRDAHVRIENTTFVPTSPNATNAIAGNRADVDVRGSTMGGAVVGVNVFRASLNATQNMFYNNKESDILLTAPISYDHTALMANDFDGKPAGEAVTRQEILDVNVEDANNGSAVPNATVTVQETTEETGEDGNVRMVWGVPLHEDARPALEEVDVIVESGDRQASKTIPIDAGNVTVSLPAPPAGMSHPSSRDRRTPALGVAGLVGVLAGLAVSARRIGG